MQFKELAPLLREDTTPFTAEYGIYQAIQKAAAKKGVAIESMQDLSDKLLIGPWDVETLFHRIEVRSSQDLAELAASL